MDLRSLRQRLARIGATVAPPRRLHPGLVVVFRACDGDGKPAPLPDVPHRHPEPRDPSRGLDVVWVGEDGAELSRCA
jgi:hypothetical protein